MPQINWSLLQPVDVSASFTQGIEAGQKRREDREYKNALGAWAQNPDDPAAIGEIMRWKPEIGYKIYNASSERQETVRKRQKEEKTELDKVIGNLAAGAKDSVDWDARVEYLAANGVPGAASYKGKFSPEMRAAAMAQGGVKEANDSDPAQGKFYNWLKVNKPELAEIYIRGAADPIRWIPTQDEQGNPQMYPMRSSGAGVGTPAAGGAAGGDIPTIGPDQVGGLPPGSRFRAQGDPSGAIRTVPGGPTAGPSAGFR